MRTPEIQTFGGLDFFSLYFHSSSSVVFKYNMYRFPETRPQQIRQVVNHLPYTPTYMIRWIAEQCLASQSASKLTHKVRGCTTYLAIPNNARSWRCTRLQVNTAPPHLR
jgi:hypothetical protein